MAAQTITDEVYGEKNNVTSADLKLSAVKDLSEVTITKGKDTINVDNGKVVYVKHESKNGKTGYYTVEGGCTATSQNAVGNTAFTDDLK